MSVQPDGQGEYRIKPGLQTRPVQLRGGESVGFTREALDKAARDAEQNFIPLGYEHLSYLAPLGRIYGAEVVEDQDGEAELVFFARDLPRVSSVDLKLDSDSSMPVYDKGAIEGIRLQPPSRNFAAADWKLLRETAPFPADEGVAWSGLPPLIWLLTIPVGWGSVKFAGSFLSQIGSNAADSLTSWIREHGIKARQNRRQCLFQVDFETSSGISVSGFLPFDVHSSDAIAELKNALVNLEPLAEFSGGIEEGNGPSNLRSAAFFYVGGEWQLGWWATDEKVAITPWYANNCPDPKPFLEAPIPEDAETLELRPQGDGGASEGHSIENSD
jgi:hypothetical protein